MFRPDTRDHFYVSYRTPESYDAALGPEHRFKVQVHSWARSDPSDETPDFTFLHAELSIGESYQDDANSITISFVSGSVEGVEISITTSP